MTCYAGESLPGFPFGASGRVMAPVTPVRLMDMPGLQLIAPAFDGLLYIIDGQTACAGACPLNREVTLT
jgi:hypothetical protein